MEKVIDINAGFGEKIVSLKSVAMKNDLDNIFRRVESRAEKWVEASKKKGPCDRRRIEELLAKRAEYLGLRPREIVWCASVEELKEKFRNQSTSDLLYDRNHGWVRFIKLLENQLRSQVREPAKIQSSDKSLSETFGRIRDRAERHLEKIKTPTNSCLKEFQEGSLGYLWDLFINEKGSIWRYKKILEFWSETTCVPRGAYYDCLWYCLPNRTSLKNYYAYLGEAYGEGLAFWLPTKKIEFLVPLPNRPFENIIRRAEELPVDDNKDDRPGLILEELELFEEKLSRYKLSEEILVKTQGITKAIKVILGILKKDYPESSLISEVERMTRGYLADLLKSYAGLSEKNRSERMATMLLTLGILEEELQKISEVVESRKISEFEIMAEFLKEKFRPDSFNV